MARIGDSIVNTTLVVCALSIGASVSYRAFQRPQSSAAPPTPTHMRAWDEVLSLGRSISGDDTASTTVAIFGDLQCPACKGYHEIVVRRILEEHPHDVRVLFLRFPLSYHKYALPAARATECIHSASERRQWIDLLYSKQDSLGLKSWGAFAAEAGLRDTSTIVTCADGRSIPSDIAAILKLGKDLVRGTPTVAVNGWVYPHPPSVEEIDSLRRAATGSSRPSPPS